MAVTTKKLFNAVGAAGQSSTTVFASHGIELNNQDDIDVYVTKTTAGIAANNGKRILHYRQSTASNLDSNHPQVNNTDGLYFPAITASGGTESLQNYQLTNNNNDITFNSALPAGAVVFVERRTRDGSGDYTTLAGGSTIRSTEVNRAFDESNFTGQDARNKVLEIEGAIFDGDIISPTYITTENIVDGTILEADIANSAITSNKIADNAVTTTEILNGAVTRSKIAADAIDGTKLDDNAVNSEHYTDGSIEHVHLTQDCVDGDNIADDAVNVEHIANNAVRTDQIQDLRVTTTKLADDAVTTGKIAGSAITTGRLANDAVTIDKISDAVIVTNSEQASHSVDDNTFFTTSAAEARYFNASTGETIKDGQSFPDNDTTIATTAAINDRIIDLVDDVGGFVPIANETSFPTANPDVNNGAGTIVSVSAASTNLAPSGTTVTIANGRGSGLAVIITGVSATIPSGFGFLVETTTTAHTYTFHRLSPKATEVTTVAGKATEIGRLGTADAVNDMAILGTADVVADLNTLGTADVVSDLNTLGTADVVADMNTLAVTSVVNNMDTVATNVANVNLTGGSIANVNTTAGSIGNVNTVAGSIANVNTVGGAISNVNTTAGSIANVNTVASNINSVNSFFNTYRIGTQNPSTSLDIGDLFFNQTSNSLKVYTGSAWVDGVTATGNFALKTGNTFTGSNTYNNNAKALFGTTTDLEIFSDGSTAFIEADDLRLRARQNDENYLTCAANGAATLFFDGSAKLTTTSTGILLEDSSAKTTAPLQIKNVNSSGVCTNAKLEFHGRTVIGQGSIPYIQSVHGTEAGGNNSANDGGLEFHTRNGGTGTDTMCMHMSHDARVGIGTILPDKPLHLTNGNGAVIRLECDDPTLNDEQLIGGLEFEKTDSDGAGAGIVGSIYMRSSDSTGSGAFLTLSTGDSSNNNVERFRITDSGTVQVHGLTELNGDVNLGNASSDTITVVGHVDSDIVPSGTTRDLGSSSSEWRNLFINGTAHIDTLDVDENAGIIGNLDVGNGVDVTGNITCTGLVDGVDIAARNILFGGLTSSSGVLTNGVTATTQGTSDNTSKVATTAFVTAAVGNVTTDLVGDSSPQLGGDLDTNSFEILLDDNHAVKFGNTNDLTIFHNSTANTNEFTSALSTNFRGKNLYFYVNNNNTAETAIMAYANAAVELSWNGAKKLETTSGGVLATGDFDSTTGVFERTTSFTSQLKFNGSNETQLIHASNGQVKLSLVGTGSTARGSIDGQSGFIRIKTATDDTGVICRDNSSTDLRFDDSTKLETDAGGVTVTGNINVSGNVVGNGSHTTELGSYNDGQIKRIRMSQGGELHFGDTTTSNFFGITEGTVNQFNDQDVLSIYCRNKLTIYTNNNTARWNWDASGHFRPNTNNSVDIGSDTHRVRNIYTNDLHLSNKGSSNDVDGTWGNWTIQEGESDLFLKNNRSGKKYKFNLMEVA